MKWRIRKSGAKIRAKHRWHDWFAWYPVRVPTQGRMSGMHRMWFCTIRRKGLREWNHDGFFWEWRYAETGQDCSTKKKPYSRPTPTSVYQPQRAPIDWNKDNEKPTEDTLDNDNPPSGGSGVPPADI